jgi:two-component system, NarL family, nitrate/nitrite response regulator NarL
MPLCGPICTKPALRHGAGVFLLTTPVSVLLCEPQPLLAEGVRSLLISNPAFSFAGCVAGLDGVRRAVAESSPRIIVCDKSAGMQELLNLLADSRLASQNDEPQFQLVVWGTAITEGEALRFLQAGARGILRKNVGTDTFMACLDSIRNGRSWMDDGVFRDAQGAARQRHSELTPREAQVLQLVEHGLKNREIARELGIRPGTVKIHLKHVFEKTGVRGRYGLALTGLRERGVLEANSSHA